MTARANNQRTSTGQKSQSGKSQISHSNGHHSVNDIADSLPQFAPLPDERADLPTFPMESGWREVTDPKTGNVHRTPLTLLDFLYPTEDDIGVVHMPHSIFHDLWLGILQAIFHGYLNEEEWLITSDVFIYWHLSSARPTAPDLAVFREGQLPTQEHKSYRVGKDGPVPEFVLEITSEETRHNDLYGKLQDYAAAGVREYLVVDIETPSNEDWHLLGYRLTPNSPFYQPIAPDEEGGLVFETIGYRFTSTGRSKIDVYNAKTGERLLKPSEQRERAESAEERAESAEERAESAEERAESIEKENEDLRAELARYKSQQDENSPQ